MTYPQFYAHVMKDKEVMQVNFSSIAMVCNIKSEKAKTILTDIFSCLIELGRSNHSVIKMNLQDFGSLNLYKNREFSLQLENKYLGSIPQEDSYSMFEARNQEHDIGSVIDGASAILSKNGDHVLSVRSSLLSGIHSI